MLIIANWKAYVEDLDRAKELIATSKKLARSSESVLVIAPSAPFLGLFAVGNKSKVTFAVQDISATPGGAKTGEVTASAASAVGATYAIVGHSERRALGDTNETITEKLSHAFAQGLTPILCIGEHKRDTEGWYLNFVREQIVSALSALTPRERARVIIAYEPIWAIGKSADQSIQPHDLTEMILYIRKVLAELLPGKNASHTQVVYGGAVETGNIRALAGESRVDGFLIGHASIDPKTFSALVQEIS